MEMQNMISALIILMALSYLIYAISKAKKTYQSRNTHTEGYLAKTYKNLNPLMTDLYQLIMSSVYFDGGRESEEASFYMHWRTPPFKGTYTVASGLEGVIDFLQNFKFSKDDIKYLKSLKDDNHNTLFTEAFLDYLSSLKLDLDVYAVPEGTIMLGKGPVVRVSGPLIQCQLVESAILNIINASSMVSTRAARLTELCERNQSTCIDFSLRRSPSLESMVARAAYIGGLEGTATISAGQQLGIPVVGTLAHSFITSFQSDTLSNTEVERQAFRSYLKYMPGNSVLLIDTFDPERGIINALEIAEEMNIALNGVRIDSGDIYQLVWYAHTKIQEFAERRPDLFKDTHIFITDGLDENKILNWIHKSKEEKGVEFPAKRFGVGTHLGNPGPFSGGVYKLSAFRHQANDPMIPTMKLSGKLAKPNDLFGEKTSLPGAELNTLRLFDKAGIVVGEVIVDTNAISADHLSDIEVILKSKKAFCMNGEEQEITDLPEFENSQLLLAPVFKRKGQGKASALVYDLSLKTRNRSYIERLNLITRYAKEQMKSMPENIRDFSLKGTVPLFISLSIYESSKNIMSKNTT